jgi:hypothetical protein
MRIQPSFFTVSELRDTLERNDLVINRDYQRGSRLWPSGPRSYFIDTILNGFPFPKMYFYEHLDRTTRRTRREIVDGQQRITAITDFLSDKYALTSVSRQFSGKKYSDLSDDDQNSFLMYSVPVDVILNAEKSDILEMFRRMNSYTLPLNDAEKRHSSFQGPFKWFITRKAAQLYPIFSEFGIFTDRQIVRMDDAELLVEVVLSMKIGITSSSNTVLSKIYEDYEQEFPYEDDYAQKIDECFDFIASNLGELRGGMLMKPYAIHSLCCALLHNKYGIPGGQEEIGPISGYFTRDVQTATQGLEALARAHEAKEIEGEFAGYVWGSSGGTNRAARRKERVLYMYKALQCELL